MKTDCNDVDIIYTTLFSLVLERREKVLKGKNDEFESSRKVYQVFVVMFQNRYSGKLEVLFSSPNTVYRSA